MAPRRPSLTLVPVSLVLALALSGCGAAASAPLPAPGARADAPRAAAADVLTPGALVRSIGEHVGREVVLEGTLGHCELECTMMLCGEGDPCCNDCGAALVLVEDGAGATACFHRRRPAEEANAVLLNGTCGGSECEITCGKLTKGARYRVRGVVQEGSAGVDARGRIPEYRIVPSEIVPLAPSGR